MIIEKTILTVGTLNNNNTNVYYSPLFLEKIASQKGNIDIILDSHDAIESVGSAIGLRFEDDKLIATMDINNDYINPDVDVGFSTEFIPSKWNGNELIDGYLDKIVFLSNLKHTEMPNDTNTITKLYNTENGDNMEESLKLSEMYGKSQEEYRVLKEKFDTLTNDLKEKDKLIEKIKKEYSELQKAYDKGLLLYNEGKAKYEEVSAIAKKFTEMEANKKNKLVELLVPENDKGERDEFKLNMYNKLSIEELESLVKDKPPLPSTPPNGASGNGLNSTNSTPNNNVDDSVYLNYKEAYNL